MIKTIDDYFEELIVNTTKLVCTGCFILCLLIICEDIVTYLFDYNITTPLKYQFAIIQSIYQLYMLSRFTKIDYNEGIYAIFMVYAIVILPIFLQYHV